MYQYQDINAVHLEVTSKCQAKCPMCPRRFNGGPLNPFVELTEVTLYQFKSWFEPNFIKQLVHLSMCGNLGDPILATSTLEIFRYLRSLNPSMRLVMHTNGSAKNKTWWQELAKEDVKVVFGIDGLEDTHHLYRIDTNFSKIIENATAFINNGGSARWDMLVFSHNKHQVEECRALSQTLGFESFTVKHTSRFRNDKLNVLDDQGKTRYILYPTDKSKELTCKTETAQKDELPIIQCKAKKDKQIYVSATGNVMPCCWLDLSWVQCNHESRIDYMNKIQKFPNLNDTSLKEVFSSGYFNTIEQTWSTTGLKECSKQCGSFDKLNGQFV